MDFGALSGLNLRVLLSSGIAILRILRKDGINGTLNREKNYNQLQLVVLQDNSISSIALGAGNNFQISLLVFPKGQERFNGTGILLLHWDLATKVRARGTSF